MQRMPRRGMLAAVGASALAGCTGAISNLPIVGEDPVDTSGERTIIKEIDEDVEVPAGEFYDWQFSSDQVTWISYQAEADSSYDLDFLMMDAENFEKYRNGEDFRIATNGSQTDTEHIRVNDKWEASTYVIVADNTDRAGAKPPGNADDLEAPVVSMNLEAWVYR